LPSPKLASSYSARSPPKRSRHATTIWSKCSKIIWRTSRRNRGVVLEILDDIETVRMQPVLALCISPHSMHVHRSVRCRIPSRSETASPARRE
jgi:hypothetical protein